MHTTANVHTSTIDEPLRAPPLPRLPEPAMPSFAPRKIAELGNGGEVFRMRASAPAFERDVLALRAMLYGRSPSTCRDVYDDYAEHYVSYHDGVPQYAARVIRAVAGPIECEEHYPRHLLERYRDRLSTSGRFVRNPNLPGGPERTNDFMGACWTDLVARGVRIDISNSIGRMLPYYRQFGYMRLCVPPFRHPIWGTDSHTVLFIADPALPGSVNARLPVVADPIPLSEIDVPHEAWSGARTA